MQAEHNALFGPPGCKFRRSHQLHLPMCPNIGEHMLRRYAHTCAKTQYPYTPTQATTNHHFHRQDKLEGLTAYTQPHWQHHHAQIGADLFHNEQTIAKHPLNTVRTSTRQARGTNLITDSPTAATIAATGTQHNLQSRYFWLQLLFVLLAIATHNDMWDIFQTSVEPRLHLFMVMDVSTPQPYDKQRRHSHCIWGAILGHLAALCVRPLLRKSVSTGASLTVYLCGDQGSHQCH